MTTVELGRPRPPGRVGLGWASSSAKPIFGSVTGRGNSCGLLYGVVNTLSITFIANEAGRKRSR